MSYEETEVEEEDVESEVESEEEEQADWMADEVESDEVDPFGLDSDDMMADADPRLASLFSFASDEDENCKDIHNPLFVRFKILGCTRCSNKNCSFCATSLIQLDCRKTCKAA